MLARHQRRAPGFTRFDGLVERVAAPSPVAGRALSPTSLEHYAACPRRYFFDNVLWVHVPQRPEDVQRISRHGPGQRGPRRVGAVHRRAGAPTPRPAHPSGPALVDRRSSTPRRDRRERVRRVRAAGPHRARPAVGARPGVDPARPARLPGRRRPIPGRDGHGPRAGRAALRSRRRHPGGGARCPAVASCSSRAAPTGSTAPTTGSLVVLDYKTGSKEAFRDIERGDDPTVRWHQAAAAHLRAGRPQPGGRRSRSRPPTGSSPNAGTTNGSPTRSTRRASSASSTWSRSSSTASSPAPSRATRRGDHPLRPLVRELQVLRLRRRSAPPTATGAGPGCATRPSCAAYVGAGRRRRPVTSHAATPASRHRRRRRRRRRARQRIRHQLDQTLFVEAGAGTGKTSALVGRIVELVATGTAPMHAIAAITFTEAAAGELRDRIRQALEQLAASPDGRLDPPRRPRRPGGADARAPGPGRAGAGGAGRARRGRHQHPARLRPADPGRAPLRGRAAAHLRGLRPDPIPGGLRRPVERLPRPAARRCRGPAHRCSGPWSAGSRLDQLREVALELNRNWDLVADHPVVREPAGAGRGGPGARGRWPRRRAWPRDAPIPTTALVRHVAGPGRLGRPPGPGRVRPRPAPAAGPGARAGQALRRPQGQLGRLHRRGPRRAGPGPGRPRPGPAAGVAPGPGRAAGGHPPAHAGGRRAAAGRRHPRVPRPAGAGPPPGAHPARGHRPAPRHLHPPAHRRVPGHRSHPDRAGRAHRHRRPRSRP